MITDKTIKDVLGAKMEFSARITMPDGIVIEKTIDIAGGIPSASEMDMHSVNGFLESFDKYEKAAVKGRNQICNDITKAHEILTNHEMEMENGTVSDTSKPPHSAIYPNLPETLNMNSTGTIIKAHNDGRSEREKIRLTDKVNAIEASPDGCCYISIDDIGVKHQKEERKSLKIKERKYVENRGSQNYLFEILKQSVKPR